MRSCPTLDTHLLWKKTFLLSREFEFILACSQAEPTQKAVEFINEALQDPTFKIEDLPALSNRHGVLPLVYKRLKELSEEKGVAIPETLLSTLQEAYFQIARRNILLSAELIRILKLLESEGIEVLAFKGPALAQIAYGDITLRQFGDLDLLIKEKGCQKIPELLHKAGYEMYLQLTKIQKNVWYRYAKDMVFFNAEKNIYIETHWLLLDSDYPFQINTDVLWENPQSFDFKGYGIRTFSNEALLAYLTIHGSKHLWERIGWVKDIDQMVRTQTIDWEALISEIKKGDARRMLLWGLCLAQYLFHTPLPETVREHMHKEKNLPKLSAFVFSDWIHTHNMFANTLAMLRLFPGIKMKLLYFHKIILKPSYREYSFIDLPKGFYWVYYLVRPYLLLKKYLTKY